MGYVSQCLISLCVELLPLPSSVEASVVFASWLTFKALISNI